MKKMFLAVICALILGLISCGAPEVATDTSVNYDYPEGGIVSLWSFDSGTTEGWHGVNKYAKACSAAKGAEFVTSGASALEIDLTGVKGWNQDVALFEGPFPPAFHGLKEITMDVYVPEASVKGMTYQEMYFIISGKANAWYQLKKQIKPGMNQVVLPVDNSKVKGEVWKVYIVVNSTEAWTGPIYVDTIKGKVLGAPSKFKGTVIDKASGKGLAGALVVIGDKLLKTDGSGNFSSVIPSDTYKVVVVKDGYKDKTISKAVIDPGKENNLGALDLIPEIEPRKKVSAITIDASKSIRKLPIDKHKMYGNNLAAWHPVGAYRDNTTVAKIKKLGVSFLRIPGGDYGNQYDWKTGEVYNYDGGVSWTPELNYYGGMVPFIKRMEKEMAGFEVMPILNIMTPDSKSIDERVDYQIQWLQDMKNKGIKFKYVEVGNEPDNKPHCLGPAAALKKGSSVTTLMKSPTSKKVTKWWTSIDNVSNVFNWTTYKVKKAFPDDKLKLMGPCPMQPMNQERLAGEPWLAPKEAPYWVEKFLKKSAKYVDTLAIHEYPLWANNNAIALLKKPQQTWPVYMPKFRSWIKKYVNSVPGQENKYIEVALTEWNSGEENSMTALIENALFCADYLGSFMKEGGDMAFFWDLFTQKPGQGGGHGMFDAENDPTNRSSERGHYWPVMLYAQKFGTNMVKCESDNPDLSVYAATGDNGKLTIMAINKTKLFAADASIAISGTGVGGGKAYQFSKKEYVWSKDLYKAIVNDGPSEININGGKNFKYTFPPFSVTLLELSR